MHALTTAPMLQSHKPLAQSASAMNQTASSRELIRRSQQSAAKSLFVVSISSLLHSTFPPSISRIGIQRSISVMGWLTRLLAGLAFLAAGVLFSPQIFRSDSDAHISVKLSTYLKLAHLLSFSAAFGTVLWVTFIGGIVMFKNLPRHQFGDLQSKMFPAYFSMVGICCAISVASFGYQNPWKSSSSAERYQLGFLLSSFAFSLTNLFAFTPMTVEMMKQRHKVEKENNIGDEVGGSKNEEVAKVDARLAGMNKKFGMIHGLSSLSNIMTFGGLVFHSCYLASKIHF